MNTRTRLASWGLIATASLTGSLQEEAVRCTWGEAEHLAVLEGLRPGAGPQARKAVAPALKHHAEEHGWVEWDQEARAAASRCNPASLEAVAEAAKDTTDSRVIRCVAEALERNGRGTEAVSLLTRARDRHERQPPTWLLQELGRVFLRAENYEQALDHFERVTTSSPCGNCADGRALRKDRSIAQCLIGLDRWEDLAALCRKHLGRGFGTGGMCFSEYLLDAAQRRGEVDPAAVARRALRLPPEQEAEYEHAARHWLILRMPREEAARHLIELLEGPFGHSGEVQEILQSHPGAISRWARTFEIPRGQRSTSEARMIGILADTGDDRLEWAVQEEARHSPSGERILKRWERARDPLSKVR
jgi:tetratricopeptide (TPR) repeat protein